MYNKLKMVNKNKKLLLIFPALIAVIIIAFTIFLKIYLTPERVKVFLITEIGESLNRKVNIEKIDISLFKGIEATNFVIKEADEKTDFIRCKNFVLKYKFLPLLSKRVIIDELRLLSPQINVIRNKNAQFNLEGIGKNQQHEKVKEEKQKVKAKKLPLSLTINKAVIKDGMFSFADFKNSLPDIKGSVNVDMGIKSIDKEGFSSQGNMDLRLDEISFKKPAKSYRDITAKLKYSLNTDREINSINIDKADLKIQGMPVSITGTAKNLKTSPEIDIYVLIPKTRSANFQKSLIPFINIKGLSLSGNLTANLRFTGMPGKTDSLKSNGEIKMDSVMYRTITISDFYTKYQLKGNRFEIMKMTATTGKGKFDLNGVINFSKPLYTYTFSGSIASLHLGEVMNSFFPKAKDTASGVLSANLKLNGAGITSESIKKNLVADGDFNIKEGKITNNKMLENLALFTGINELKTIDLTRANGTIKIRNGIAHLDSIFSSTDISMDPSGNIGLDKIIDLSFDLKLSPHLTEKALKKPSIASYIKDEEGWGRIPLNVSGTFANPSYSINIAKAGRRAIKKKVEKLLEDLIDKSINKGNGENKKSEEKNQLENFLKDLFR